MTARGPIRVLHLRDSPWVDGPGRTILETAARIDRSRIDYTIAPLVPDDGAKHPLVVAAREQGLPVQPVIDTGALASLVDYVTELVDQLGIEILHSSEFRTNLVALRVRRRRPSLKIVSTAHGWIANDFRGKAKTIFDRVMLRQFDLVILVSNAMRRKLSKWWLPVSRVEVIHNALALDKYGANLGPQSRRLPGPSDPIKLLAVGRLSPEKGLDLLLRAVAELMHTHPRLQLTIAGIGSEEAALRELSSKLGMLEIVSYAGYVRDMPSLYAWADLVVQSSLTEGFPNVMLEASFLAVPVVATDVGGTQEIVVHGTCGWLVSAGSVRALVKGIREYLNRPEEFATMALKARDRVIQCFSIDKRTEKQARTYEAMIGLP